MEKFITHLVADSVVRINRLPFYLQEDNKQINLELPGAVISIFDRYVKYNDILVPQGILINVEVESNDIEDAIVKSEAVALYIASILSCTSMAAINPPKPIWSYNSTLNKKTREYIRFVYDPILKIAKRKLDQTVLFELLEKKFNIFMQNNDIKKDRKNRLGRAITSFRRGISDNDDVMTEFLIHWSSLETLDVVYREMFEIVPQKIYVKCGQCETEYKDCPTCGKEDVFIKSVAMSGVEEIFTILGEKDNFNLLRRLRNGMIHGFETLDASIRGARDNLEIVRKAVLLMIMKILNIDDEVQKTVLGNKTYKGKMEPYYKLIFTGEFEPKDVREVFSNHPQINVKYDKVNTGIEGEQLILQPSWSFSPANVINMSLIAHEIYGEDAQKLDIKEINIT